VSQPLRAGADVRLRCLFWPPEANAQPPATFLAAILANLNCRERIGRFPVTTFHPRRPDRVCQSRKIHRLPVQREASRKNLPRSTTTLNANPVSHTGGLHLARGRLLRYPQIATAEDGSIIRLRSRTGSRSDRFQIASIRFADLSRLDNSILLFSCGSRMLASLSLFTKN
jgi:hypothetical protein